MTRILIIEDDTDFADILKECLLEEKENEIVAHFTNEEDVMNFLKTGGLANVDCVLADLQLPRTKGASEVNSMVGLRIVETLRQQQRFFGTILVLTNSRAFSDGERALAAGCDGYLCKHTPMAEVPSMLSELKIALRGDVMLVSREMRHVFIREDLSVKEARLMDLLNSGHTWAEIARELGYKTPKAAANIGYRVFDKLLTSADRESLQSEDGERKRHKALERWRARIGHSTQSTSHSN